MALRLPIGIDDFRTLRELGLAYVDEDCRAGIQEKLRALYEAHRALLDGGHLSAEEAHRYQQVIDGSAPPVLYHRTLLDLSHYLHRHHGERVIVLIDEYDEPIHAGYLHGYAREALDFFRAFLTEGLKGNPHLHRAVLTGILRIARESIFSGLNNLAVYSLLNPTFATCFGFTEPEVAALLDQAGRRAQLPVVQRWYNGYLFGGQVIARRRRLRARHRRERGPGPARAEPGRPVEPAFVLGLSQSREALARPHGAARPLPLHSQPRGASSL